MKGYVIAILTVSVISGFVRVVSPKTQDVSLAVKLVIICIILSPLIQLVGNTDTVSDILVIKEDFEHSITNEEADVNWRRWVAEATANQLSDEISKRLEEVYRIEAQVIVPWREEEGGIVFDKILVYANVDEAKREKIESWISLHYSLDSVCVNGESGDG
ncbi:MAG: hypothetical protein IJP16_07660 [Clostridia bacterium]|nr:hypothetical protein [Clostridia bacterium]